MMNTILPEYSPYIPDLHGYPLNVTEYTIEKVNHNFFDLHYQPEIGIVIDGEMERDYNGKELFAMKTVFGSTAFGNHTGTL
ncbi:MAG: hypothetical protein HC906_07105 [Bacteroidales bacterium]|nr:hypothetical protein [Bacteroidales bacterium]